MMQDVAPRSARLFTQQYWLEDTQHYLGNAWYASSKWYMGLEHLRVTLRRGDWWDWERNR
ncbi:hypothetical protein Micbo1qcDRAFT_157251, partial [Microdochium bolleyi]